MDPTDIHKILHPNKKNTPSSLHLIELSPMLTTYLNTKSVSIDKEKLKEPRASYKTTMC